MIESLCKFYGVSAFTGRVVDTADIMLRTSKHATVKAKERKV